MVDEKYADLGPESNIFKELGESFDASETENMLRASTNWWRIGTLASTLIMWVAVVVFVIFGTDALLKSLPAGTFPLETGLFAPGGALCNRVDAGLGGVAEVQNTCLPLSDLDQVVEKKTEDTKAYLKDALSIYLNRKFNSNVMESALAKFIMARGEGERIPYVDLLGQIYGAIQQTINETGIGRFDTPFKCGTISFVQRTVTFSCEIKGYPILEADRDESHVTARIAALTFLKNLQSIDKVKMRNPPKSLSSSETDSYSVTTIPVEFEYILDANQL